MLISISKAIFRNHFLIRQIHCPCLYMPVVPLHTPGLSIDSDFQHNPQLPFPPEHTTSWSFGLRSSVGVMCTGPSHPLHLHPPPFTQNTRLACPGFEVLYQPRNDTTTCTPLHRITSMTVSSLALYDLRSFDAPCVALFPQPLPSFSRPFTTALVMDMLNLAHDDTYIDPLWLLIFRILLQRTCACFRVSVSVCFHPPFTGSPLLARVMILLLFKIVYGTSLSSLTRHGKNNTIPSLFDLVLFLGLWL